MDYEKKLALAKEALDSGSYDKETIEYIFPELKESEDEKIKRELIDFVKSRLAGFPQCEKFIAWLEKQGEPIDKIGRKFNIGDIVQYITDSTDRRKIKEIDTLCNMYHTDSSPIMFEIEDEWKVVVNAEDIEQEPADVEEPNFFDDFRKTDSEVEPKFRIGDVIEVKPMKCHGKIFTGNPNKIVDITEKSYILDDGKAYNIELQDGWKLSEQKSAWSEEDIIIKKSIIEYIASSDIDNMAKDSWISWLKYSNLHKGCVNFRNGRCEAGGVSQNAWKPSDGQMKALGVATNIINVPEKEYIELEKLYQDLEKLREG